MEQSQSTRQKIIDAAKKRFGTSGYESVSMADLAADVGITKASLYHFFENKDAIYTAVVEYMLEHVGEHFAISARDPEHHPLCDTIEHILSLTLKEGNVVMQMQGRICRAAAPEERARLLGPFQTFFSEAVSCLSAHGVPTPELATVVLLNAMQGYAKWAALGQSIASPKEYSTYLSSIILSTR